MAIRLSEHAELFADLTYLIHSHTDVPRTFCAFGEPATLSLMKFCRQDHLAVTFNPHLAQRHSMRLSEHVVNKCAREVAE
ncbi:hypothetical protein A5676_20295 [Mycobacterium malmoense]|nr:hypothetical protein A5676_20295 [Mycobacterium malmoense]